MQRHSYLPICPIWACPLARNLSNQAALRSDFAEPISLKPLDGFIAFEVLWIFLDLWLCNIMVVWPWPWIFKVKFWKCFIWMGQLTWNEQDVSRLDVTPTLWLSTFRSPKTLTLDFQGQILKKWYLRNGMANWHRVKGMWVDRMLDPCCDFQLSPHQWPWPWIFKVKFWKSLILWMGWPIDTERKGCESIECLTHVVTFNVLLFHDPGLRFSMSNLEKKLYLRKGIADPHMERKGCGSIECYTHIVTSNFDLTHDLDLGFWRLENWNCCNLWMGGSTHLKWKGCELYMMLDAQWDWPWATVHGK